MRRKARLIFIKFILLSGFAILLWSFSEQQRNSEAKVFLFTGDIFWGETYQAKLEEKGKPNILKEKGYDYSFANLDSLLSGEAMVIANLETPVTDMIRSPLADSDKYKLHRADAQKTPAGLKRHNIFVVSLANNHALDYGIQGLSETMSVLKKNDISFFGAGNNDTEAATPYHFKSSAAKNSFHMVVIGMLDYDAKYDSAYSFYATHTKAGVNMLTEEKISQQIKNIRMANKSAFVVAYPHWFENYVWKSEGQTALAHAMIDAGADIVIGHGAHMLQEIEIYKGKWIIYSLGNFVFNSPGRYAKFESVNPYSAAALLTVDNIQDKETITVQLYPFLSNNIQTNYQPRLVNEKEFEEVLELLFKHSPNPEEMKKKLKPEKDPKGYHMKIIVRE